MKKSTLDLGMIKKQFILHTKINQLKYEYIGKILKVTYDNIVYWNYGVNSGKILYDKQLDDVYFDIIYTFKKRNKVISQIENDILSTFKMKLEELLDDDKIIRIINSVK